MGLEAVQVKVQHIPARQSVVHELGPLDTVGGGLSRGQASRDRGVGEDAALVRVRVRVQGEGEG